MPFIVTPFRRRLAMAALLGLAVAGAVIRALAPDPSAWRDLGTMLLVLWLPAVGNLIGYLARKIPRRAPPVTEFADPSAFTPHLQARIEAPGMPAEWVTALDPADRRCTLIMGRRGFTARLAVPVVQALAGAGEQTLAMELLHPGVALPRLAPGTDFHLLVGTTAVARGRVESVNNPAQD